MYFNKSVIFKNPKSQAIATIRHLQKIDLFAKTRAECQITTDVPCASDPHTDVASFPCFRSDRTNRSAGISVLGCPICAGPFAYGSPQVTKCSSLHQVLVFGCWVIGSLWSRPDAACKRRAIRHILKFHHLLPQMHTVAHNFGILEIRDIL